MRLLLGGPAYRMEVDARHAASMLAFACRAQSRGVEVLGAMYAHGTPVAYARNDLFREALADPGKPDVLLWWDSDCATPGVHHDALIAALVRPPPCLIIPTPQRNGTSNVWLDKRTRIAKVQPDGEKRDCWAGGFGAVAFRLDWYREHWPAAPWFQDGWDPEVAAESQGDGYTSEDYNHCRGVWSRGGKVQYLGAWADHYHRGHG